MPDDDLPHFLQGRAPRKKQRSLRPNRPLFSTRVKQHQAALKELNVHKPLSLARAKDVVKFQKLKDELRLSYASVAHKFDDWKHFSDRNIKFAQQYARNGRRSATQAMRMAGLQDASAVNVEHTFRAVLKLDGMEELIAAFEFEEKARMKLNVEDVVAWFQKIATASMEAGDFTNANRSLENLGKYLQMFVERKEITHHIVYNRQELDARIIELTDILKESGPDIEAQLQIA